MLETTSLGSTTKAAIPSTRSRLDGVCGSLPGVARRQRHSGNESSTRAWLAAAYLDRATYLARDICGALTLAADPCVRTVPVGGEPGEKALRVNGLRFKLCGIVATFVKTTISLCTP